MSIEKTQSQNFTIDEIVKLINKKSGEAISGLEESVLSVYAQPENKKSRAVHIGTAFLMEIKGINYLITANHVIKNAKIIGSVYFLNKNGICFGLDQLVSNKKILFNDAMDFYFFQVDIPFIGSISCPIFSENLVPDVCVCFGYPNSKNKKGISLKKESQHQDLKALRLHLYNTNSEGEVVDMLNESPYFQKWREKTALSEENIECDSIGVSGMSGAPCFQVPISHEVILSEQSLASEVKVAGILIEYKKDLIKFIRMSELLKFIDKASFPL